MTAPVDHGHYAQTKDGPVWVGPSRGELAHLRAKLEIARQGLLMLAEGHHTHEFAQAVAADALRRSGT